jgi:hypothetical protein
MIQTVHCLRRKGPSDQAVDGIAESGWGTRIPNHTEMVSQRIDLSIVFPAVDELTSRSWTIFVDHATLRGNAKVAKVGLLVNDASDVPRLVWSLR